MNGAVHALVEMHTCTANRYQRFWYYRNSIISVSIAFKVIGCKRDRRCCCCCYCFCFRP